MINIYIIVLTSTIPFVVHYFVIIIDLGQMDVAVWMMPFGRGHLDVETVGRQKIKTIINQSIKLLSYLYYLHLL